MIIIIGGPSHCYLIWPFYGHEEIVVSNLQIIDYFVSNLQIIDYFVSNLQIIDYFVSNLQIIDYFYDGMTNRPLNNNELDLSSEG